MAGQTKDATQAMQEILQRYSELSQQGEALRQILAAGGQVPCPVWGAYNDACLDYLKKSQSVLDQLTQRGIEVDQVVYSGGQPVPDPDRVGYYKTVRTGAPLRPPAFGFTAAACPGITSFQGATGWVPIPIEDGMLGSVASTVWTSVASGAIFVLTGGTAPVGAVTYGGYKVYKTVAIWLEDFYNPPMRIVQAFTDCVVKLTRSGMKAADASKQCASAQSSAQQYAKDKAAADSWGFWSWVGVGTAVLVVGGALALYLRGRLVGVSHAAQAAMMGLDGLDDCCFGAAQPVARRLKRIKRLQAEAQARNRRMARGEEARMYDRDLTERIRNKPFRVGRY